MDGSRSDKVTTEKRSERTSWWKKCIREKMTKPIDMRDVFEHGKWLWLKEKIKTSLKEDHGYNT